MLPSLGHLHPSLLPLSHRGPASPAVLLDLTYGLASRSPAPMLAVESLLLTIAAFMHR